MTKPVTQTTPHFRRHEVEPATVVAVRNGYGEEFCNCLNSFGNQQENADKIITALNNYNRLREAVLAVLCDPEGVPCFEGSDGDRKIIAEALDE